jgi:hypothetical protein
MQMWVVVLDLRISIWTCSPLTGGRPVAVWKEIMVKGVQHEVGRRKDGRLEKVENQSHEGMCVETL